MSRAAAVRHAVSYLSVAALCLVLDVASVYTLHLGLGVPLVLSVIVGFAVNGATGFALHRRLVFKPRQHYAGRARRRYALLLVVNVAVGVLGVSWAVASGVPYPLARVVASLTMLVVNYVAMRWWVFQATSPSVHEGV